MKIDIDAAATGAAAATAPASAACINDEVLGGREHMQQKQQQ